MAPDAPGMDESLRHLGHMKHIRNVAKDDIDQLEEKEKAYGGSWKKRGGVGAFMMLARKWDRIENRVQQENWDVFKAIELYPGSEGLLNDIGDLRRYLMLVEAEIRVRTPIAPVQLSV